MSNKELALFILYGWEFLAATFLFVCCSYTAAGHKLNKWVYRSCIAFMVFPLFVSCILILYFKI